MDYSVPKKEVPMLAVSLIEWGIFVSSNMACFIAGIALGIASTTRKKLSEGKND